MATLKVLDNTCAERTCASAATREVYGDDGKLVGRYCTRHAQKVLIETTEEEKEQK